MLTANMALTVIPQSQVAAETTESISIKGGAQFTNATEVQLTLASSTAVQMQFSNDETTWSDWETYATLKTWNLTGAEEATTAIVFVQFKDASDQVTIANDTIILDMVLPIPNVYVQISSAEDGELFFDGSLSYDNIGLAAYAWDFGDGQHGTGSTITHKFTSNGTFYGNLTVTDLAGNTAISDFWVKLPITVKATPTPEPTATPIEIRTPQPTPLPTTQPTPETSPISLSPTMLVVIVAVVVIVVVGLIVILRLTRSKPSVPPAA
jgi:hypothetical protein